MSGNEGPARISGTGGQAECAGYRGKKPLQAPDPNVLGCMAVGDELVLDLQESEYPTIIVVTPQGEQAGAIVPDATLVACLRLGMTFIARVASMNGPSVMLEIFPS